MLRSLVQWKTHSNEGFRTPSIGGRRRLVRFQYGLLVYKLKIIDLRTSSAKAKGRVLQQLVRDKFREQFKGSLEDGDIESRQMGGAGEDIVLSPLAKKLIPFDVECKNQQNISIWSAIEQAESNSVPGRIPLVVFKKNRKVPHCVVSLDNFMKLVYKDDKSSEQEEARG